MRRFLGRAILRMSTSTLRACVSLLSRPPLVWLLERPLGEMTNELLARELPSIAEEPECYLVEWILGSQ